MASGSKLPVPSPVGDGSPCGPGNAHTPTRRGPGAAQVSCDPVGRNRVRSGCHTWRISPLSTACGRLSRWRRDPPRRCCRTRLSTAMADGKPGRSSARFVTYQWGHACYAGGPLGRHRRCVWRSPKPTGQPVSAAACRSDLPWVSRARRPVRLRSAGVSGGTNPNGAETPD